MADVVKLADGQYPAVVYDYGIFESKAGKPQVKVTLKILAKEGNTPLLSWFGSLSTEQSRTFVLQALNKVNPKLTMNTLLDKTQLGYDNADFNGQELSVTIKNEPHPVTNVMQPRVKYLNPPKKKFEKLKPETLASLRGDVNLDDVKF